MKRVLIIRNAYQQDTGGAEEYAFNLALALQRAGHKGIVVTKHKLIHDKCRKAGIKSVQGIWYEKQDWDKRYYLRYVFMPFWYMWLILRYRVNIVHPQSRDDFVFATKAGKWLRKKVIWTDHADLKYLMDKVNHYHPRMQAWLDEAAKITTVIMCVSQSELKSILAVAPQLKGKLQVVYNGVFIPENIKPIDKKGLTIIGTNARLVDAKGINELLQAFAVVAKKHTKLELWLLGAFSNNKAKYEALANELGISNKVRFLGYKPDAFDYMASMDIFVHASYHEAFSLAVIEGCMLGLPMVTTNVGGTPEIINDQTGILIPPRDAGAIERAVDKLLNNKSLSQRLATAAANRARREFDFQKIVEQQILPIYEGNTS